MYSKIRYGTATTEEKEQYDTTLPAVRGKSHSSVKRETPEQRQRRLEKQRLSSRKRLQKEAAEERERRLEADRIRKRLRRDDYPESFTEKDIESLETRLKSLQKIDKTWWKVETEDEWLNRLRKDRLRHRQSTK